MQGVQQLFQQVRPVGENTPTECRAEELLEPYVTACERAKASGQPIPKPMNLLVLTDGACDDPPTLAYALAGFAERLEEARLPLAQLGIYILLPVVLVDVLIPGHRCTDGADW